MHIDDLKQKMTRITGCRQLWLAALLVFSMAGGSTMAAPVTFKPEYVFVELFPKKMQDAFLYAANDLLGKRLAASYESERIDVLLRWRELGWPGVYAQAQVHLQSNFGSQDPDYQKDTYYPSALASHLAGKDAAVDKGDIILTLNISSIIEGKVEWYFGIDGKAEPQAVDYVTLVLHELVHGIGFYKTIREDGSYGMDPSAPAIYDRFVTGMLFDEAGKPSQAVPLTKMATDADRAKAIRWPELTWNGEHGKSAATGDRLLLYAPKDFDAFTSVTHVGKGERSLMNPFYDGANHTLDGITLGMLEDMGWNVAVPEPSTTVLLGLALGTLVAVRAGSRGRRRRHGRYF